MVLIHEEKDNHNYEGKKSNKAQSANTRRNLKMHISLVSLYL